MADNNQQVADQASAAPVVSNEVFPPVYNSRPVTNLGVNEATTLSGQSVQSPLSGSDVSMTTGQHYGGPIVSTEIEPGVRNETNPYGHVEI